MKKHLHKLILFSATACLSACTAQEPLTDYVDPQLWKEKTKLNPQPWLE